MIKRIKGLHDLKSFNQVNHENQGSKQLKEGKRLNEFIIENFGKVKLNE